MLLNQHDQYGNESQQFAWRNYNLISKTERLSAINGTFNG